MKFTPEPDTSENIEYKVKVLKNGAVYNSEIAKN